MTIARVIGSVTATMKHPDYEGKKILAVQPVDHTYQPAGKVILAVDAVQAGIGDIVLVIDEGSSARLMLKDNSIVTIRTVIGGIVDKVTKE